MTWVWMPRRCVGRTLDRSYVGSVELERDSGRLAADDFADDVRRQGPRAERHRAEGGIGDLVRIRRDEEGRDEDGKRAGISPELPAELGRSGSRSSPRRSGSSRRSCRLRERRPGSRAFRSRSRPANSRAAEGPPAAALRSMRTFEVGLAQFPKSALTRPFSSPWSERFARLSFWKPAAFVWKRIESVNVWWPTSGTRRRERRDRRRRQEGARRRIDDEDVRVLLRVVEARRVDAGAERHLARGERVVRDRGHAPGAEEARVVRRVLRPEDVDRHPRVCAGECAVVRVRGHEARAGHGRSAQQVPIGVRDVDRGDEVASRSLGEESDRLVGVRRSAEPHVREPQGVRDPPGVLVEQEPGVLSGVRRTSGSGSRKVL